MTVTRTMLGRPLRGVAFDVAVSAAVALIGLAGAVNLAGGWAAVLVCAGMAVALLFRRAHPGAVTVAVAALGLVQVIAQWGPLPFDVAVLIALYSVVKYGKKLRDAVLAGVAAAVGVVLAAVQTPGVIIWWVTALWYALVTGAVWLVALNVRTRRLYVLSLEERAMTLEREREAESRAAVAEERTRIARELHDVVAHSMAVMIVQADGARFMLDRDPAQARTAVRVVADTGRAALEEMRRLVGVLRDAGPSGGDGLAVAADPEHRRLALAELPDLLARFGDAGLHIRDTVTGEPPALPPGLELTVYRVVQEALTNALKHAGVGAVVEVALAYTAEAVVVRVRDDGRGRPLVSPAPSGGHGLLGMRERVTVYDGSLTAGPRPAGGWQVEVRLPLPSDGATEVIAA
ncbi:two-component sensor histidine kinase [Micromonospora arborensis]|uniref:histidine kinase n=1 Tax=Micromonospora arborensis TaxID=2116518 RepID=A0A318NKK0_9ACTN|nr:sensor histidine kinase [Micromonospora arborensis]PYC63927.1 two-component sensor histidine kinase [Micromonospora arborensis]